GVSDPVDPRAKAASLVATGFNRCGPVHLVGGNTDPEVNRNEVLTEMTDAIGSALLGLTLGCARCHDHKFDPLSQREYYGLQAFCAPPHPGKPDIATAAEKEPHRRRAEEIRAQTAPLKKQITDLEAPYRARLSAAKHAALEPKYREALAVES